MTWGSVSAAVLVLLAAGCAPLPVADDGPQAAVDHSAAAGATLYRVRTGDTLSAIAARYGLDYRTLARWNGLDDPDRIYPGQRLFLAPRVPNAPNPERPAQPASTPRPQAALAVVPVPRSKPPTPKPPATSPTASQPVQGWLWPTVGDLVGVFRPAEPGGKGIQIKGQLGQAVRAARGGRVVYSGSGLPGYGRLIIIKHSGTLLSAYGYLGRIHVEEGEQVQSGQTIAELGINNENQPVLHFEVRRDGKPIDPMGFLSS